MTEKKLEGLSYEEIWGKKVVENRRKTFRKFQDQLRRPRGRRKKKDLMAEKYISK